MENIKEEIRQIASSLTIILGATAVLTACSYFLHSAKDTSADFSTPSDIILNGIKLDGTSIITFDELANVLQAQADVLLLDARAGFFYGEGHIRSALNLEVEKFDEKFPPMRQTLLSARLIIVYCTDSQCPSSKSLAQKLLSAGVKNISIYPGGWEEWRKRKGAIEK